MSRRVLLVGAGGVFGSRLAELLARQEGLELVLAGRRPEPLIALADKLRASSPAAVHTAVVDRRSPGDLASLDLWAVVDAAGPFQASDLTLAKAALAARAHYIDLADARDFVARAPGLLDAEARAAGRLAVTGASSTPALSDAVVTMLSDGWRKVEDVTVAISPGGRAPRGTSVIKAILSYAGRPVRILKHGEWRRQAGWGLPRPETFPGVGIRWVSLCETPDLDLIPQRHPDAYSVTFLAGVESPSQQWGLWLLTWPVRLRLVRNLTWLARPLRAIADLLAPFASDHGGMFVSVGGIQGVRQERHGLWGLAAYDGSGPYTPAAPAAALLRKMAAGRLELTGAYPCVGLLSVDEIMAEIAHLPIKTRTSRFRSAEWRIMVLALGDAFETMPRQVQRVHGGSKSLSLKGSGWARASRKGPSPWMRRLLGLPEPGPQPAISVSIDRTPHREIWTRRFGGRTFRTSLHGRTYGRFEERIWPLSFGFEAEPTRHGFRWRLVSWRLGLLPLPMKLAPMIRARTFELDGAYRFRVAVAHRWLGLVFGYAGRLK